MRITRQQVAKVLAVVDKGLTHGLGDPKPGKMCVEAAVCYAFGESHNDQPRCVDPVVSALKIILNDKDAWPSDKARAKGLRRLAIAQLGTRGMAAFRDYMKFSEMVVIRDIYCKLNPECDRDELYIPTLEAGIEMVLELGHDDDRRHRNIRILCEAFVRVMIRLKTPGSKYLDEFTVEPKFRGFKWQ
jgi:hypothetical protein